jgi:hypothetical protein
MAKRFRQKVLWFEQSLVQAEKNLRIAHDLWSNVVDGRLNRGYHAGNELGWGEYGVETMNSLKKKYRICLDEVYMVKSGLADGQKQLDGCLAAGQKQLDGCLADDQKQLGGCLAAGEATVDPIDTLDDDSVTFIATVNARWNADQRAFDEADREWADLPSAADDYLPDNDHLSVRFNTSVVISGITPGSRATWITLSEEEWPEQFHPGRPGCPASFGMRISVERRATIYAERPDLSPCYKRGANNDLLYEEWHALWDASLMDVSIPKVQPKKFRFTAPIEKLTMVTSLPLKKLTSISALDNHPYVMCADGKTTPSIPYWWPKDTPTARSIRALFQSTFS